MSVGHRSGYLLGLILVVGGCAGGDAGGGQGSGGGAAPRKRPGPPPSFGPTVSQAVAPPPISGGTLLVLRDGTTAIAADPDRDRVAVVDLVDRRVLADLALLPGDEPGRSVEDGAGRVHVALRRGGALVTIAPGTWTLTARQPVCPAPRGVAYEAAGSLLHVACAGGELVSLPSEGGSPVRALRLERDLRDVVVDGSTLVVSRFRSAEALVIDRAGHVIERMSPASLTAPQGRTFTPSIVWRMLPVRGGELLMVHQRGLVGEVPEAPGGYGGADPCSGIVHSAVGLLQRGAPQDAANAAPPIPGAVLPVDLAISPDGQTLAVAAPGNAKVPDAPQIFTLSLAQVKGAGGAGGCEGRGGPGGTGGAGGGGGAVGGSAGSPGGGGAGGSGGHDAGAHPGSDAGSDAGGAEGGGGAGADGGVDPQIQVLVDVGGRVRVTAEVVAVAYDGQGRLVIQTREPAALLRLPDVDTRPIILSRDSRADTGHAVFHASAGSQIACASCHPEGGEDGRTWRFAHQNEPQGMPTLRDRRTQSVRGGISGSEPFHWSGDMSDLGHLVREVFVGRMSGPALAPDQVLALGRWLDGNPELPTSPSRYPAAVERGRALFHDAGVGCATCHGGPRYTNNASVDVGTGGVFQVPFLRGVGARAPFLHTGCALTLADRFGSCGGGDRHGRTSHLGADQIADLVSFLESL